MVWHGPAAVGAGSRRSGSPSNAATRRCDRMEIGRCSPNYGHDATQSRLNEVDIVQPALFAIQVAAGGACGAPGASSRRPWWAIAWERSRPRYVAGALSFDDAVRVICHRSRCSSASSGKGPWRRWNFPSRTLAAILVGFEGSRVDRCQQRSHLDRLVRRSRRARRHPGSVAAARHLLSHGEGRFRLAQPADGPVARRFPCRPWKDCSRRLESVPIYSTVTGR